MVNVEGKPVYPFYGTIFSNFAPCHFTAKCIDGETRTFKHSEQYFMANKAILFKDYKMRDEIMNNAKDPWHVKACGRKVTNFDNDLWEEKSYEIMKTGVREKFQQNPEFLEELLKIGKTHRFAEASPTDRKWGIGIGMTNPDNKDPSKWRGKNWLGQIFDELYEEFSSQSK